MAKLQNVTRAHLGLLLANLVWAVNYPFYKVLMPHITPVALATFAVTVAGLLGLVSLFWGGIEKIDRNDIYKFIGAALLMGIAKKLLLMIGMQHTSPIEASIIATLGPILVLVFRDRPVYADEGFWHGVGNGRCAAGHPQRRRCRHFGREADG